MTIVNELDLDALVLKAGSHAPDGEFCVMEAVAFMAGEPWSDHPKCASPIISAFMRQWNDDLDDAGRQELKPYITKLIGSKGTKKIEDQRAWMCADWLVHSWLPLWLRIAGMDEQADEVEALPKVNSAKTMAGMRQKMRDIREVTWAKRKEVWGPFEARLRAELAKRGAADAAAAAAAAADAVAVAVAVAAADADAVAVAAAVAVAVAAAVADADAAAAAAAAADAVAVAVAVAAADADYWTIRMAVYKALRAKFKELIEAKHGPVIASSRTSARKLLDDMLALT